RSREPIIKRDDPADDTDTPGPEEEREARYRLAGRRAQHLLADAAAIDVPVRLVQDRPRAARPARHFPATRAEEKTPVDDPPGQLRGADHGEARGDGWELRDQDRVVGRTRFGDLLVPVPARA